MTLAAGSLHPVWLRGFLSLLQSVDGIDVVGHASDAPGLLDLLARQRPDMLVIDSTMLQPVQSLAGPGDPLPRVLVVGRATHAGTRPLFGPDGCCGYVSERESESTIAELIGQVGRCTLARPAPGGCADCPVPRSFRPPSLPFSEREREVFERIGWGLGPSEIAAQLGVHVKTVETHREAIKRKLGLSSSTQLLDAAFKWRDGEPLASASSSAPPERGAA
ncbi:MAG: response regulator transcription factor [Lysobacteraceae bacterium]|nr:MAG: response regulator transcription factor [Xanthomonadaceae bacterium]